MAKKNRHPKEKYTAALRLAKDMGFDGITYAAEYKGHTAYHADSNALKGTVCGYPHFIIADLEGGCRFATTDEALEIIDEAYSE